VIAADFLIFWSVGPSSAFAAANPVMLANPKAAATFAGLIMI
jgi:hypothetical protein